VARKHDLKRDRIKRPVEQTTGRVKLATPKVTEIPEAIPGSVVIQQPDGTVKHYLVEREIVTTKQGRAQGSTHTEAFCGQRNVKENMAPRGKAGAAPLKPGGHK
jgi:hypothetical protein